MNTSTYRKIVSKSDEYPCMSREKTFPIRFHTGNHKKIIDKFNEYPCVSSRKISLFCQEGIHSRNPKGGLCRAIISHRHLGAVFSCFSVCYEEMLSESGLGIDLPFTFSDLIFSTPFYNRSSLRFQCFLLYKSIMYQ